jgi:tRNA/tmRNA/rRNA uracil-C5-methylase (TrmA/RlmC/RlmD family)
MKQALRPPTRTNNPLHERTTYCLRHFLLQSWPYHFHSTLLRSQRNFQVPGLDATEDQEEQSCKPRSELGQIASHQEHGQRKGQSTIQGPLVSSGSFTHVRLFFIYCSPIYQTYSAAASFVPKLTQKVLQYLNPQPSDRILDVGCGDGKFTANFAFSVAEVYGVDTSPSFIASAIEDYGNAKTHFKVVDCRYLEQDAEAVDGKWDKV